VFVVGVGFRRGVEVAATEEERRVAAGNLVQHRGVLHRAFEHILRVACIEVDAVEGVIDKKSLFRRHGHPPAGTGLNERFHGGNVAESGRWRQVRLQTRIERIQGAGKTAEMQ